MKKSWLIWLATLGPLGAFRGSGTYATIATLPLVVLLSLIPYKLYAGFILLAAIIAFISIRLALPLFPNNDDPADIVVDEIVGTLVTFWMLPLTGRMLLFGTVLFRYFDIKKPFFLKNIERIGGATGILLDDIVAAIFANLTIQLVLFLASC